MRPCESRPWENATSARRARRRRRQRACFRFFFEAEAAEAFGRAGCKISRRRERFARLSVSFVFQEKIRRRPIGARGRIFPPGTAGIAARAVCRPSRRVPSWPDSNRQVLSDLAILARYFAAIASVAIHEDRRESRRGARARARRCHRGRHVLHRTQYSESPRPCRGRCRRAPWWLFLPSEILRRAAQRFVARPSAGFARDCNSQGRTTVSILLPAALPRERARSESVRGILHSRESRRRHAFAAA